MFYRGNVTKNGTLLKQRRHPKNRKTLKQPEWDATTQDLTVHAATPEEVLKKRLRRKSKNADAARRELKAKKAGIPADLMLGPAQLQLEMKKLAILKEVLYDHNDFNEVVRQADKTMSSLKDIFHETTHKNAHPNVTSAPRNKTLHPMAEVEQPSRLDALSDSMMDSRALNHELTPDSSDHEEDGVEFESRIDCNRFLSLLKETMNQTKGHADSLPRTPENPKPSGGIPGGSSFPTNVALNGTEEVIRTMSRISHHDPANDGGDGSNPPDFAQTKRIGELVSGLSADASRVQRKLNASSATLINASLASANHQQPHVVATNHQQPRVVVPPPRGNLTACNMTYDNLQDAMADVEKNIAEFEHRTGRAQHPATTSGGSGGGLAGFTATLIDAVTRLIQYVNDGELKQQQLASSVQVLTDKLEHVQAVTNSLTLELKGEQEKARVQQVEIEQLKLAATANDRQVRNELDALRETVRLLGQDKTDRTTPSGQATTTSGDQPPATNQAGKQITQSDGSELFAIEASSAAADNCAADDVKVVNLALKNDMIVLLNALRTENQRAAERSNAAPPSGQTQEAAQTIASVESQLRHLKLQHAEAEQRMDELSKHVQRNNFASSSASSTLTGRISAAEQHQALHHPRPPSSSSVIDVRTLDTDSLPTDTARSIPRFSASPPCLDVVATTAAPQHDDGRKQQNLAVFDTDFMDDQISFQELEREIVAEVSTLSDGATAAPTSTEQHQAVLSRIQKTQMSLEDRIAELNRQHGEAQNRLHNLVQRRRKEKAGNRPVQETLAADISFQTPRIKSRTASSSSDCSRAATESSGSSSTWFALPQHT